MSNLTLALGLFVAYVGFTIIYRLYLSPLAKIPGPKIAALTSWYNGYYDLFKDGGGQYIWVIEKMHEQYGPILRTRPDAVHVNDAAFVDILYSSSPKARRERYWTVLNMIHAPGSILATADHDLHRRRRAVLNPYFSLATVRRLEPILNDTLVNLLHRMDGWAATGKPITLNNALRAATKDVIHAYCFGEAEKCLDMEDCNAAFFDMMAPNPITHLSTHFNWLAHLLASIPPTIMIFLMPRIAVFARFMENLYAQIGEILKAKEVPEGKTIFHEVIRSDIPASEKTVKRLGEEAMVITIAGSDTTASTLGAIIYHLLADPSLLARLKTELATAMPDPNALPIASQLDSLPLLNAIIKEALRLYPGATHRQDRTAPDEDLIYTRPSDGKIFTIPAGTAIGMTAPLLNRRPELYERPNDFLPQRYLDNPALYKHLFTFSKGTRQCIGMHLAYQELQTFTAGVFRRYDVYDADAAAASKGQQGPTMELYETTREDIALFGDCVTPKQYDGSLGLRVVFRR